MRRGKLLARRLLRPHALWFLLSAASFLAAFGLTEMITAVHGGTSFATGGLKAIGAVNPFEERMQIFEVYLGPPDAASESKQNEAPNSIIYPNETTTGPALTVSYDQSADNSTARLTVIVPAEIDVKILVNNLVDSHSCEYQKSAFAEDPEAPAEVNAPYHGSTVDGPVAYGSALHVFSLKEDLPRLVACFVRPMEEHETFVRRRLRIASFSRFVMAVHAGNFQKSKDLEQFWRTTGLNSLHPVHAFGVDFRGIEGAERFFIDGGRKDASELETENGRLLDFGDSIAVSWTDLYREELRDIILIIIGTLVAVGVTTLIEGLRPFIERAGHK